MFFRKSSSSHVDESVEQQKERKFNELKASLGPLSGRNLQYCSDACLKRYLEARNWNVDKSKKMLEETLRWRSSFKPEEIRWHEVASEGETGKVFRANFRDRQGRTVLILRPGMQVVKYFLDSKTFQKVKFVYPKKEDSVELMRSYFDVDNLPTEFGGKATLQYDHEEFSRQMAQDDVKSAKHWGLDKHQSNGFAGAEVAPEPESLITPVS
ncbi:random slug protein 5 [Phtheirospermum japonicum]|uniref:Random slug protein 5 n=1 Tax=Phtheirospermum japonicum TaxID=374723 RepID=A0A830CS30_9LAMI|nr:random slug protein 5 [Phtheirospermum japonicum]